MPLASILGGEFGMNGRYLLATTPRVVNGLHSITCMVLDAHAGTVIAMANARSEALAAARRAVRATQIAERRAALAAATEAGQAELWPEERPARASRHRRMSRRRRQVFEASGGACWYCRVPLQLDGGWHEEHARPRALGGGDDALNLVAACRQCNLAKSNRTAIEFVSVSSAPEAG